MAAPRADLKADKALRLCISEGINAVKAKRRTRYEGSYSEVDAVAPEDGNPQVSSGICCVIRISSFRC